MSHPGPALERDLLALRDIVGVEGSFVIGEGELVIAHDPRLWIDPSALRGVAGRICRLLAVIDDNFEPSREVFIALDPYSLSIRWTTPHAVVTMVRPGTNLEALKMATNLLLRKLARGTPVAEELRPRPLPPSSSPLPPRSAQTSATPSTSPVSASLAATKLARSAAPTVSGIVGGSPRSVPSRGMPSTVAPGKKAKKKSDIWG